MSQRTIKKVRSARFGLMDGLAGIAQVMGVHPKQLAAARDRAVGSVPCGCDMEANMRPEGMTHGRAVVDRCVECGMRRVTLPNGDESFVPAGEFSAVYKGREIE